MTPLTIFLAVTLVCILIGAPLIASFALCVPKWWAARVTPVLDKLPSPPPMPRFESALNKTGETFVKPIGHVYLWPWIIAPVALPLLLIAWYATACFALIEQKCPYRNEWDWRNKHEHEQFTRTVLKRYFQHLVGR